MSTPETYSNGKPRLPACVDAKAQEFTGSKLISKEEWLAACSEDSNLLQILDHIEQDKAYIGQTFKDINELMRPIRQRKLRIRNAKARIESRRRQYRHFAALLRKRLAYEKIKQLRKDIGLT